MEETAKTTTMSSADTGNNSAEDPNSDEAKAQDFVEIAIDCGYLTPGQAIVAQSELEEHGISLLEMPNHLVKKGVMTQEQLRACERMMRGRSTINGFQILERVGRGGMGTVFRARQLSMDRVVAVKILAPHLAQDPQFKLRFLNEARVSARLSHLNIINGIDCGEDSGYTYFAMEFVDGKTLKQVLRDRAKLPPEEALAIIRQLGDALVYASKQNLVHRDIKPDNIMITCAGVAKLCDLGLAKETQKDAQEPQSDVGLAVGTPHYMSPEQARGEKSVDCRSDIYSLGATFYHLLTGRTPFAGNSSSQVMRLHLSSVSSNPCDLDFAIPEGFGQVVSKMMAKAAADRYATPEELIEELETLKAGKRPKAADFKAATSCQMLQRAASQRIRHIAEPPPNRFPAVIAAVVMLSALGAGAYFTFGGTNDGSNVNPPHINPANIDGQQPDNDAAPEINPEVTDTASPLVANSEKKNPDATNVNHDPADLVVIKPVVPPDNTPPKKVRREYTPTPAMVVEVEPQKPEIQNIPRPPLVLNSEILYARFLKEVDLRAGRMEVPKMLEELRVLALKPEYKTAQGEIAQEMSDIGVAAALESAAMRRIADMKAEVELSEEAQKKYKIARAKAASYDAARNGLTLALTGVQLTLPASNFSVETILKFATDTTPLAQMRYCYARGNSTAAFALQPKLAGAEPKRWERKLFLLVAGEQEMTAREAVKGLSKLAEVKSWGTFSETITDIEKTYRNTPTVQGMAMNKEVREWRARAAEALVPQTQWQKLFHSAALDRVKGGFISLTYDFSKADQARDFACTGAKIEIADGRLKIAETEGELTHARFCAPIAEIKELRLIGRCDQKSLAKMYVFFLPIDGSISERSTCLMLRGSSQKAHLKHMAAEEIVSEQKYDWNDDVEIVAQNIDGELVWSVNGEIIGKAALPKTVAGGWIALGCQKGNYSWKSIKMIFKPDDDWVKSVLR